MASEQFAVVGRQLGRLLQSGTVAGLSEGQLLDRFVTRRDDAAFEAIVARHGPMVQGVCRGILRDPNDVDDAFQATFLILVRKAAELKQQELLANWLYGVAYRVARRARGQAMKRSHADAVAIDPADPDAASLDDLDIRPLIHEELSRLPESYRAAVVLCYLEGQTHEAAATQLGWPIGTVKGRLARAKDMLRARLTRKGLAVSTAGLALALAKETRAAVPDALVQTTTNTALTAASAGLAASTISPHIASLAGGVLQTMAPMKLKYVAMLAVAGLLSASGVSAYQFAPNQGKVAKPKANTPTTTTAVDGKKSPERLRVEEKLKLIDSILDAGKREMLVMPTGPAEGVTPFQHTWDTRRMAVLGELNRIRQQEEGDDFEVNEARRKLEKARQDEANGKIGPNQVESNAIGKMALHFAVMEAEDELARAEKQRAQRRQSAEATTNRAQARSNSGENQKTPSAPVHPADIDRNKEIEQSLEKIVKMQFPNETPLEDVLKYIKEEAKDAKGRPIPIYLNPMGLATVEKTITAPVTLDIDGLPLRTTLRLILDQLDMAYEIHDGLLEINSVTDFADRKQEEQLRAMKQRGEVSGGGMGGGMGGFGGMGGGMGGVGRGSGMMGGAGKVPGGGGGIQ